MIVELDGLESLGKSFFTKDILRDEDEGRAQGAEETESVCSRIEGTCQHDTQGERD